MATSQQKSRYGQPDGQRWASFTSSDKIDETSVPTEAPGGMPCVSGHFCFRCYFQKSRKVEKETNYVHEKDNK